MSCDTLAIESSETGQKKVQNSFSNYDMLTAADLKMPSQLLILAEIHRWITVR